jgi:very-short-patch-repair endonuclease
VLDTVTDYLDDADWYSDIWVEEVMNSAPLAFDRTIDRWRGLFRAAREQQKKQNEIANNVSKPPAERNKARRLRREAEAQLELLLDAKYVAQSDFYSYRYFASEGFLPGYNFPRLPLSAFIPGRRSRRGRDEFLSRPRFLAISEFGPRSIVYHEGARYLVNKVILPADSDDFRTAIAKVCSQCGYLHHVADGDGPDLCEACGAELGLPLRSLFRLQNVSTVRRERINSDQEERVRLGYDLSTAYRFEPREGAPSSRTAVIKSEGEVLGTLTYGGATTLWRVNLGWSRRANKNQTGFVLDTERGYWARSQDDEAEDPDEAMSNQTLRVIPYVEDRKNALFLELSDMPGTPVAASLQSALKRAIQVEFELEEFELAAEPLPSRDERRRILFYEAAEGGAGVLRRLIDDPMAIPRVARRALDICHFDPDTGHDLRRAPGAREDCEAACYDCLMSYSNQMDHPLLDRQKIKDLLLLLTGATVESSSGPMTRAQLYDALRASAGSGLEKQWLEFLWDRNLHLPSKAQKLLPECGTRPDFLYEDRYVAVYIDGPVHDQDDVALKDVDKQNCLRDQGYTVLRFRHDDEWEAMVSENPAVFGSIS